MFSAAPSDAAGDSLLNALEGKAGKGDVAELLKQGVTALLNASHPAISNQFAFSRDQVIDSLNTVLANGDNKTLSALKKQLETANKDCLSTPPTNSGCPACVVGYPYTSTNPLTSLIFNESEILRGYSQGVMHPGDTIKVWYNDEHAIVLGVRQVIVKTSGGSVTNNYSLSPLLTNPGSVNQPQVGSTALTGDQAGTDVSNRPMFPALFVTDVTTDPNNKSGDWQFGGTAIPPQAVFGTWKGAVRIVDKTRNPPLITVDPDPDSMAKNNWNLGSGDPPPAGLVDQGYGAEVRWNVDSLGLVPGHMYRLYFMVHDGDQNKVGGDVGHACVTVCYSGQTLTSPRAISMTSVSSGQRTVLWNSMPGKTYRLQYKNALSDSSWIDLPGTVTATSTTTALTDGSAGQSAQRFYRIVLVP